MLKFSRKQNAAIDRIGLPAAVFLEDGSLTTANNQFFEAFAAADWGPGSRFCDLGISVFNEQEEAVLSPHFPVDIFDLNQPFPQLRTLGVQTAVGDPVCWYRLSALAEYEKQDRQQLVVTFSDVTDLVQSRNEQKQITQAKKEWETTVDALQDIVTIQNLDMEIVRANKVAHEYFGHELGSLKDKKCYEVFLGLDAPCERCPVYETGRTCRSHTELMYHEQIDKTFRVSSFPILDEKGDMQQVVHVARDVSQFLQDASEKSRLMAAIEQTSESVVMTDSNAIIEYVNPAFLDVTGYARGEVIGQNPSILKSGEHDRKFYATMWGTLLAKKVWQGKLTNKKKDGSLYIENATITPVLNREGEIVNFVALKRDITREVSLEQQVQHASKLEALGILAGGIAHDFNNILASIIGHGEIAKSKLSRDDPVFEDVQQMLDGGDRAVDLVKQILTFSRREKDGDFKLIYLQNVIHEISDFLRPSLPTTIQLKLEIDKRCGTIHGDPSQLYQVLMNLCNNSKQAIGNTHGIITIRLWEKDVTDKEATAAQLKKTLLLEVRDTGCGIAEDELSKIFDPFYTTKQNEHGTGLGLSVVHGILKKHKAKMAVESDSGGTLFQVEFPLDGRIPEEKTVAPEVIGGNETILVVDDEPPVAKIITAYLKRSGYRVLCYNDSMEAVKNFRRNPDCCDLVITDMSMPGMTGAELSREFLSIRKDLPIIMLTGHSENFDRDKALRMGLKEYMLKPIKPKQLNLAVRKGLDHGNDTRH